MSDKYSPPPVSPEEKKGLEHSSNLDVERANPSGRARWFGGRNIYVGPRIGPVLSSLSSSYASDSDDSSTAILHKQKESEANAAIQYRTCSWQKVWSAQPCLHPLQHWARWMLIFDMHRLPRCCFQSIFVW